MGWISKLFSSAGGGLIKDLGDVADKFITTKEEKQEFILKMEAVVSSRLSALEETHRTELGAKERILVAELSQDDKYTKRARPTVVYFGLAVIGVNYCIAPIVGQLLGTEFSPVDLPTEFWWGWSGIVTTWAVGRSMEKIGVKSKTVSVVTGSRLE